LIRFKYYSQYFVPNNFQYTFFSLIQRPSFTLTRN
jgi:hypothetical protein